MYFQHPMLSPSFPSTALQTRIHNFPTLQFPLTLKMRSDEVDLMLLDDADDAASSVAGGGGREGRGIMAGELRDRNSSFSGTAESAAVQRMGGLARVSLSRVVREGGGEGAGGRQYMCAGGTHLPW